MYLSPCLAATGVAATLPLLLLLEGSPLCSRARKTFYMPWQQQGASASGAYMPSLHPCEWEVGGEAHHASATRPVMGSCP